MVELFVGCTPQAEQAHDVTNVTRCIRRFNGGIPGSTVVDVQEVQLTSWGQRVPRLQDRSTDLVHACWRGFHQMVGPRILRRIDELPMVLDLVELGCADLALEYIEL
eukprot:5159490-Pyramimonas_sp.AAC.1